MMRYLASKWTDLDFEGLRTIVVPSGIGELQWACAKYINAGERFAFLGLDGAPRRLHQFAALLPFCDTFAYCGFDYSQIRMWQEYHKLDTWGAVKTKFGLGQKTMLACNPHLEAGLPLAAWLPDLPTTHCFALQTTDEHRRQAARYWSQTDSRERLIGISCASYRGADAWHTWQEREWLEFLHMVQRAYPEAQFALLGGSWDDLTAAIFDAPSKLRWLVDQNGLPPVGRTQFGGAVELLKNLVGYIGFSSGLGHVALHCCDCPVFMLWPEHEISLLAKAWVDPLFLENGDYVPSAWNSPEAVFALAQPWLRRVMGEN